MKKSCYRISRKHIGIGETKAINYESAAQVFAKRKYGKNAVAIRVTGEHGKSGYFRAYKPMPRRYGGGLNSIGDQFHVSTC